MRLRNESYYFCLKTYIFAQNIMKGGICVKINRNKYYEMTDDILKRMLVLLDLLNDDEKFCYYYKQKNGEDWFDNYDECFREIFNWLKILEKIK